jgi:hypothetical protein
MLACTAIFRQLDSGELAPVGARRTSEEAQNLIASLERLWPGPYIVREFQTASQPTE